MQWRGCCHGDFLDIKITTRDAADLESGRRKRAVAPDAEKRTVIVKNNL
jgi:hypothetical protein